MKLNQFAGFQRCVQWIVNAEFGARKLQLCYVISVQHFFEPKSGRKCNQILVCQYQVP